MSKRNLFLLAILMSVFSGCTLTPTEKNKLAINERPVTVEHARDSMKNSHDKQEVINQILSKSGTDEVLKQLPVSVAMGFDQQPKPPMKSREYKQFRQNLIDAYDPIKIRKTISDYLLSQYETEKFYALLILLDRPLVKKMTALEVASQTPQAIQDMMQTGNIIMGQASPKRLEIIHALDQAMNATEMAIDMQMMISTATMVNMNKIVPVDQQMTKNQLTNMIDQMRVQSKFPTQQFVHLSMVYAYQTVSEAELEEYIRYMKSDIGLWSTQIFTSAWLEVSENTADRLSELMDKTFVRENVL